MSTEEEYKELSEKLRYGLELAEQRLIEETARREGTLCYGRPDGKSGAGICNGTFEASPVCRICLSVGESESAGDIKEYLNKIKLGRWINLPFFAAVCKLSP